MDAQPIEYRNDIYVSQVEYDDPVLRDLAKARSRRLLTEHIEKLGITPLDSVVSYWDKIPFGDGLQWRCRSVAVSLNPIAQS
jgi:hypothetical protein